MVLTHNYSFTMSPHALLCQRKSLLATISTFLYRYKHHSRILASAGREESTNLAIRDRGICPSTLSKRPIIFTLLLWGNNKGERYRNAVPWGA